MMINDILSVRNVTPPVRAHRVLKRQTMKFNRIIPPVACDSPDSEGTYFLRNSYGMIRMFSVTVEGGRTVHVQRSFSTRAELESFLSKSAKDRDNDLEEYYRDVKACFESMGKK